MAVASWRARFGLLCLSLLSLTVSTSVRAQDDEEEEYYYQLFGPPKPPPQTIATLYDWTGYYLGAWTGYGWGSTSWSNPEDKDLGMGSLQGFVVGGYVGYNWQISNLVIGVEGAGAWSNVKGNSEKFGWTFGAYAKGIEELTARVGLTTGATRETLWFVKGGAAWAQYKYLSDWRETGTHFEADKTLNGWTVGAGIERHWFSNVSYRIEYGYYNFGGTGVNLIPSNDVPVYHVDTGHTDVHVLTIGLDATWQPK